MYNYVFYRLHMSIYEAIEKLNELANTAVSEKISGISPLSDEASPLNIRKLYDFSSKLKSIADEDMYDELGDVISKLKSYAEQVKRQDFSDIIEALEAVDQKYQESKTTSDANKAYRDKYSKGLVAEICQGNQYELGASGGECFGFTMALADPELSPYERPRPAKPTTMKLTEQIHRYHKSQQKTTDDEIAFRGAIVQRQKYCFGGKAQANLILVTHLTHARLAVHF